jgi:hypothetical protein
MPFHDLFLCCEAAKDGVHACLSAWGDQLVISVLLLHCTYLQACLLPEKGQLCANFTEVINPNGTLKAPL